TLAISCTMKPDRTAYKELHQHPGTKKSEIIEIFDTKNQITEILLDTFASKLIVGAETNSIKESDKEFKRVSLSNTIKVSESGFGVDILEDGTISEWRTYCNWIINGDQSSMKYADPLTEEEKKDPEKWFVKFKELYSSASYVYLHMSDYYFKIKDSWYLVEAYKMGKALNIKIKER